MRRNAVPSILLWFSLIAVLSNLSPAQTDPPRAPNDAATFAYPAGPDRGASAVRESLLKLKTRASLIMITAHPDDEDGGLLAYESRYEGADTSLLSLNRGEGGQNVMSSNYWDELGLLRTQELLAADRYYDVHQYFTRVADFGFSKTLEEAMATWGHDRVLYDVVRVIRMTRPLVVTSVFAGNVSDGHGQHQVSGEMAQEAYRAAGDPTLFPDQIQAGLRPWSPLKVYARAPFAHISSQGIYDYATDHWSPVRFRNYVTGTWIQGVPSTTLEVPEGRYNPFAGLSYFQLARQGLNQQKSQNGGIGLPPPGPVNIPYHLYASRVATQAKESNFFDGIDTSIEGMASYAPSADRPEWRKRLAALSATIEKASSSFNPEDPAKIAPTLAEGLHQTRGLLADISQSSLPEDAKYNMSHELLVKEEQFNLALKQALGLDILATVSPGKARRGSPPDREASFQMAIPGQEFSVNLHLGNQGSEPVFLENFTLNCRKDSGWKIDPVEASNGMIGAGEARDLSFSVTVPTHPILTRPYFTRPTVEQSYYDINDPQYLNLAASDYPLTANLTFKYHDVEFHTANVVQSSHHVTGSGTLLEPLMVGPPISLWVSPAAGIIPLSSHTLHLQVTLHSNVKGPAQGSIHLDLPEGWKSIPAAADFSTQQDGDEQNLSFEIHPQGVRSQAYTIQAVAEYQGQRFTEGYRLVGYTGLRAYPYYRRATYRTSGVAVTVPPGLKVGYVMGPGDEVPSSLEDLGIHVDLLSQQQIQAGNLSNYDCILIGIRAYAVRPELRALNDRLLQYVKDGGVLVVQYQTPEFDHNYGPYPLSLGGNPQKVVDEHSTVQFPRPNDPVLNWPNKITPADFDGWIEERGHDFVRQWDNKYISLTETHDQDQQPQGGGLLYTRYGKGIYVYTAYAFYRQLPEGVPGAFRIFANLLSLEKNPGFPHER